MAKSVTREDVDEAIFNWLTEVHGLDKAIDLDYSAVNEALDDLGDMTWYLGK